MSDRERLRNVARGMLREATHAERRLWGLLRNRKMGGFKFRRQVPLGPFIADFVCMEARLVIEADGGQHADNENDVRRDAWFKANGFRLLRLWNSYALDRDDEGLCRTILTALNQR